MTCPPAQPFSTFSLALLQLVDSAFPAGGFAHSGGLEAAWQTGHVPTAEALAQWCEAALRQMALQAGPFVAAACRQPEDIPGIDAHYDTIVLNHVARRASRAQGRALAVAAHHAFGDRCAIPPCGDADGAHLAPVFGAAAGVLGATADLAVALFLYCNLRAAISAGVRLGVAGPLRAQALLLAAGAAIHPLSQQACAMQLDDAVQTSPLLDLWQGQQDALYSRLFQS